MPPTPENVSPLRPRAPRPAAPDGVRISVIGAGYVGLVTAACLAKFGHGVTAVDIDAERVAALQRAQLPIHEAGLGELVAEQLAAARLRFTCDFDAAVAHCELVFVAVGTPAQHDGAPALEAFDAVIERLRAQPRLPAAVVLKSTVPVGTAARVQQALGERCHVLGNPEFLREGTAMHDFLAPDRIIIGRDSGAEAAAARLLHAYRWLVDRGTPVLTMDTRSAELAKCAANAMLAARISFINEIAAIAEATGADIERVCDGIGSDPRIGPQFLRAGLGYGGSCFPKDVAALRHTARHLGLRSPMLDATEAVNRHQALWLTAALRRELGATPLRGLCAAVWGLAFKPGTDDMREAASLTLIERLLGMGMRLALYDPVAMANARAVLPAHAAIRWCDSPADALRQADVLLLVTEWDEFRVFEPQQAAAALRLRLVCDGRNALDAAAWAAVGLRVVQVGRPVLAAAERTAGEGEVDPAASGLTTARAVAS